MIYWVSYAIIDYSTDDIYLVPCASTEYTDEEVHIPKHSSVIVRRTPIGGVKPAGRTFIVYVAMTSWPCLSAWHEYGSNPPHRLLILITSTRPHTSIQSNQPSYSKATTSLCFIVHVCGGYWLVCLFLFVCSDRSDMAAGSSRPVCNKHSHFLTISVLLLSSLLWFFFLVKHTV